MQKRFTLLIVIFLAGVIRVQAQSMVLKTKDGILTTKSLGTLKKFTFSNNSLMLNYLSGPIETYSLDNISKLTFKSVVTGVDNLSLTGNGIMKVYPNPVSDIVYIQWPGSEYSIEKEV